MTISKRNIASISTIAILVMTVGGWAYPHGSTANNHCTVFAQNFNLAVTAGSSAQFIFTVNGNFPDPDFIFIKPANGFLTILGSGNPTMWNATEAAGAFTIQAALNAVTQVLTFYARQSGTNCAGEFTLTVAVTGGTAQSSVSGTQRMATTDATKAPILSGQLTINFGRLDIASTEKLDVVFRIEDLLEYLLEKVIDFISMPKAACDACDLLNQYKEGAISLSQLTAQLNGKQCKNKSTP